MMPHDIPHRIVHCLRETQVAFQEAGLPAPRVMVVGQEFQLMLFHADWRPMQETWGTIMGIEIRGVSEYVRGLCEGLLCRTRDIYRPRILGTFINGN